MEDFRILDRDRLELVTRGNPALANEFLEALFDEANDLIERLTVLISGQDRSAVADVAHTLKGMAMELGAMRLRAVAAALETETDATRWPEGVERLRAALAQLQAFVNP